MTITIMLSLFKMDFWAISICVVFVYIKSCTVWPMCVKMWSEMIFFTSVNTLINWCLNILVYISEIFSRQSDYKLNSIDWT